MSPLTSHVTMGGCTGGHPVRGGATSPQTKNSHGPGTIGRYRGDGGWVAIQNSRVRSRRQTNSSGDSGWAATTMCMQSQAINYPFDEPDE